MQVIIIAAVADNQVIGADNGIPWRVADDWKRFREVTTGHYLVMGRETFEGIGQPLPNRTTVVVTGNPDWQAPESVGATRVMVAGSVDEAIDLARKTRGTTSEDICWIGGGGQVYADAITKATALDITEVHQSPDGDTHFPVIDPDVWVEIHRTPGEGYDFVRYAPVLHTASLELRPVAQSDADAWATLDAIHPLEEHIANWIEDGLGVWVVREQSTGHPVGVAGVHTHVLSNKAKVWVFHHGLFPGTEGRGWTVEVARAALDQLNQIDPLGRVRVVVGHDDPKAIKAAESLGLERFDDRIGDDGQPEVVYQGVVRELI